MENFIFLWSILEVVAFFIIPLGLLQLVLPTLLPTINSLNAKVAII